MPVTYDVQARVIDIVRDAPRDTDEFLVDSNVWYWLTYTRASMGARPPMQYQLATYPAYIKGALQNGARLCYCSLSLAELAHTIEAVERDIFCGANKLQLKPKEFRHNYPQERTRVVAEIATSWKQVESIGVLVGLHVGKPELDSALNTLTSLPVDGYDAFLIDEISRLGVTQVITDDGDYATAPGLMVFTANRTLIARAATYSRLFVR